MSTSFLIMVTAKSFIDTNDRRMAGTPPVGPASCRPATGMRLCRLWNEAPRHHKQHPVRRNTMVAHNLGICSGGGRQCFILALAAAGGWTDLSACPGGNRFLLILRSPRATCCRDT